jgi:hypothetical protein
MEFLSCYAFQIDGTPYYSGYYNEKYYKNFTTNDTLILYNFSHIIGLIFMDYNIETSEYIYCYIMFAKNELGEEVLLQKYGKPASKLLIG